MKKFSILFAVIFVLSLFFVVSHKAQATNNCTFTTVGTTMMLDADCSTDATLLIPDGFTLDGNDHSITAVDPAVGHFVGAVVMNEGATAYVHHLTVKTDGLGNVCDAGADRLRGIMFEGASGYISHNTVMDVNQGPSGCQEGNGIEVRNAPFDGTHPATVSVGVDHNEIMNYQKTGFVANGDVNVNFHHNKVSESATQANLAANSVQFGYGAMGSVMHNQIDGNQWLGASDYAASAVLLYDSQAVEVSQNNIRGNAEVGIYELGDGSVLDNNKVFDEGADAATHGYDYGIGAWGTNTTVTNNKVKGFDDPYDGVTGGKNKVVPGPQKSNSWF